MVSSALTASAVPGAESIPDAGSDLDAVVALQDDLIAAYRAADTQRRLRELAEQAKAQGTPSGLAAVEQRESFLLALQKTIVARHGYDASAKGVENAMVACAKLIEINSVTKRHNHMETLLAAGEPLDWYHPVWKQCVLRNQGTFRHLPQDRYPIVPREDWCESYEGRLAPRPRREMLSLEATEELAAACKSSNTAKARLLLGGRKVGASAKAVVVNIGYKGLGPLGTQTLAQALSADLEVLELDISGNFIGPEGAKALAGSLPSSLKVLKLNVSNNRLTAVGAKSLVTAIPQTVEVLSLGLAGMKIGPEGAEALAAGLPPAVQEVTLDLHGNAIGDDGVDFLSKALPKTVEYLDVTLSGNQLSRRGFFMIDRQVGDPLHERHLPKLSPENFIKTGEPERLEFKEEADGSLTRQLDLRDTI